MTHYSRTLRLILAATLSAIPMQTMAQQPVPTGQTTTQQQLPAGIADKGYPDFRQLVDVNGDGVIDYCRFVGDKPKVYLSCQLGDKKTGFQTNPYGFNAPTGTDLGGAPRLIFPIGYMGFCRYLAVPLKNPVSHAGSPPVAETNAKNVKGVAEISPGPKAGRPRPQLLPALDPLQKLSCIEAKKAGGFDASKEIDPSHPAVAQPLGTAPNLKRKVTLVTGPDGATIELVTDASPGTWIASVQDATGRHWHLSSSSTVGQSSGYTTYMKLYSDEDDFGKPFTAKVLKAYPRANIAFDEFFQMTSAGYISYSTTGKTKLDVNLPNGILPIGFTLTRSGALPGSQVFVYDSCTPADPKVPSVPYLGTTNADGSIAWKGPQPPSISNCIPASTKLSYFAQVATVLEARARNILRTGNPAIDNKDIGSLDNADINAIVSHLESQAATSNSKQSLLDLVTVLRGIQGAFGLGGAVATSIMGNGLSAYLKGAELGVEFSVGGIAVIVSGVVVGVVELTIEAQQHVDQYKACQNDGKAWDQKSSDCQKLLMEGP